MIHKCFNGYRTMTTNAAEARPLFSQGKARRLEPISRTINILPTDSARLYTHIHPAIVLGCLYFFFPHLVNDPVTELLTAAVPLSFLQGAYCVICLPPSSGSSSPQPTPSKTPKRKRVQFAKAPPTVVSKVTVSLIDQPPSDSLSVEICKPELTWSSIRPRPSRSSSQPHSQYLCSLSY